jgi:hypothetical protein
MREITKLMINDFKIMKLGIDFMGYEVKRKESLSFHHLVVPKRVCKERDLGDGYEYWNGAILVQNTSHEYLHLIEQYDKDLYKYITYEMVDMNILGRLDEEALINIDEALKSFEKENYCKLANKGKMLIKSEYMRRKKL